MISSHGGTCQPLITSQEGTRLQLWTKRLEDDPPPVDMGIPPSLPPSLRAQSHHGSSGRGSTTWEQEQGDQKLPWPDGPWNWPNQLWVWRRGADSSTARLPPATSSAAQSLSQCSVRIKRRVKKRKLSYNQPASKDTKRRRRTKLISQTFSKVSQIHSCLHPSNYRLMSNSTGCCWAF